MARRGDEVLTAFLRLANEFDLVLAGINVNVPRRNNPMIHKKLVGARAAHHVLELFDFLPSVLQRRAKRDAGDGFRTNFFCRFYAPLALGDVDFDLLEFKERGYAVLHVLLCVDVQRFYRLSHRDRPYPLLV